jgi:uroporphyrinogen decarboxylase
MDGRERTIRSVEFRKPDRIPLNLWIHNAAALKYGRKLEALLDEHPQDIIRLYGPMDRAFYEVTYKPGMHTDEWGSTWQVIQAGMVGEVKIPALQDLAKTKEYKLPIHLLKSEWETKGDSVKNKIETARKAGQFVFGGQIEVFQRMQFIRGTENLFYDLGERNENLLLLRDKVVEYFHAYLDYWLRQDMDALTFYDDWGSQLALLISPAMWREIFKPVYLEFVKRIHQAGKRAFFHCDGNILALYPEFIELGLDAVNSQVWCIGLDKAAAFAGKMTFWGEVDRQHTLAFGSPSDVRNSIRLMKEKLYRDGGLIGQSVAGVDVPLENVKALLTGWNEE